MPVSRRLAALVALVLTVVAVPLVVRAQGVAAATLHVSVRVVRSCSVNTDLSAGDAGAGSSVRIVCAKSALRALRASTAPDPAETVTPLATDGPERSTGGELILAVPTAVVVTLHF